MDSLATPQEGDFSTPETANAPGHPRSSRKVKRSRARWATVGVAAAFAAGTFAVIEVSSAHAAELRTATITVPVNEPSGEFATDGDKEIAKESAAKNDADVQGSPGTCGTPAGEPNPTRGDEGSATIDKFSANQWRVTMTFHCLDGDNPPA